MLEDTDTPLRGVRTGVRLSKDPEQAKAEALKLTGDMKEPAFWVANKTWWGIGLPQHVRAGEVATLIAEEDKIKQGFVVLKYADGYTAILGLADIHRGHVVFPTEVTKKLTLCKAGEIDLKGNIHE